MNTLTAKIFSLFLTFGDFNDSSTLEDVKNKLTYQKNGPSGGSDYIPWEGSTANAISGFNDSLLKLLIYAGAVVLTIAVIKLIIAIQQQDANSKTQAAMLFGLGIAFVASSAIVQFIDVRNGAPEEIVVRIAEVAGTILKVVAILLLTFAVVQLILSFINEDAAQKVDAGKLMAVGAVFYAVRGVLTTIAALAVGRDVGSATNYVIDVIGSTARFLGVIVGVYGLFQVILALKDHEAVSYQKNIIMVSVGIILFCVPFVFDAVGIKTHPSKLSILEGEWKPSLPEERPYCGTCKGGAYMVPDKTGFGEHKEACPDCGLYYNP